ncbi:tripartite tricarboxylate transporter TctB family protein [Marinomonas algarum]|uniref:Tripartite tricarboxylate transporter TctB family protein n=1 Tax=Marinomonas algarum TaxID=2883105 RepID=A0A9X1INH1_9GAMM|nr:tripartite tricarboxylate transporter TctB family protein [Marinomonas algarum]MCB5161003.1 tripartite tricarboxylate transporter TctB family protein [Marinomonas algarum]
MDIENRKSRLFFLIIVVLSAYLIVFFQDYTVDVKRDHGWFTKPYVAPLFGLGVLLFFSLIKLILVIRPVEGEKSLIENLADSLTHHRVVLITAVLFYVYINAITVIGFVLSTTLFVLSIVWLSRLLSVLWAINTLVAVAIITLIFRVGVNIWIPDVALYEALFSGETLWFMNKYF